MSKAAIYNGLSKGLMSLGQGIKSYFDFNAIETLKQQNFEKRWQLQQQENQAEREFRAQEREADRAFESEQLESRHNMNMELEGERHTNNLEIDSNRHDSALELAQSKVKPTNRKANWKSTEDLETGETLFFDANDPNPTMYTAKEFRQLGGNGSGNEPPARTLEEQSYRSKSHVSTIKDKSVSDIISAIMSANGGMTEEEALQAALTKGYIQ